MTGAPAIQSTPLSMCRQLSAELGVDLRVKRDDLLPMPGGGNKVRIWRAIAADLAARGCDAVVTCGGIESNHARVAALACAQRQWPCHLVLHGDPARLRSFRGNAYLAAMAGATVEVVDPDGINAAMRAAADRLTSEGRSPHIVEGGGHGLHGSLAYCDAVRELELQCAADGWVPDWIVVPSGTGTTHAGIAAGVLAVGWRTRVIGVSVARRNPKGTEVVTRAVDDLSRHLGQEAPATVEFRDEWVGEGYESASARVRALIARVARTSGLLLDPTYTAKAFLGMTDLVAQDELARGTRGLFWHTGGLLNLLATPYDLLGGVL